MEVRAILSRETFEKRPEGSEGASSGGKIFQAKGTVSSESLRQGHGWMFEEKQGGRPSSRSGVDREASRGVEVREGCRGLGAVLTGTGGHCKDLAFTRVGGEPLEGSGQGQDLF